MCEAVKVALDPTPAQERRFLSRAGAARFAYNAALAHVKEAIDTGEKLDWSFLLAAQMVARQQGFLGR